MDLISIQQFCEHYEVSQSFINILYEYDLIEIIAVDEREEEYLKITQINEIEKMLRLHNELNINLEGIDAIYTLLKQIDSLQKELIVLKNKLSFYE